MRTWPRVSPHFRCSRDNAFLLFSPFSSSTSSTSSIFRIFFILCLFLFICCLKSTDADCPNHCDCKWKAGKESVICRNTNFTQIPRNMDAAVLVLDMDGNSLIELDRDVFYLTGVLNLQQLYLVRCKVKTIDKYAFRTLKNLVELDLSYNVLTVIPTHALSTIPELRELKLNGNPILKVGANAFQFTRHLVRLEISECRIGYVDNTAFSGLENTLELLKLNNNRIREVEPIAFTLLHTLHGLELYNNPWNCTCTLRPLRNWMLGRTVPLGTPPVCGSPRYVANRSWNQLDMDDFACMPSIAALHTMVNTIEGNNVTLSCHVNGLPMPKVKWTLRNRVLSNTTSEQPVAEDKKTSKFSYSVANSFSDLTIRNVELQDTGVYICEAENRAGKITSDTTVIVARKPVGPILSEKMVIIGILATAILIIFMCSIVLFCRVMYTSKDIATRRADSQRCRPLDKMEMALSSGGNNNKVEEEPCTTLTLAACVESTAAAPVERAGVGGKSNHVEIQTKSSKLKENNQNPDSQTVKRDSPRNSIFDSHIGEVALQHHILHKKELPTGKLYTTAMAFMKDDTMEDYPDTIEKKPVKPMKHQSYNTIPNVERNYSTGSLRRGYSNYDYSMSESQSPLLQSKYYRSSAESSKSARYNRLSRREFTASDISPVYASPKHRRRYRQDYTEIATSPYQSPVRGEHRHSSYDRVSTTETPLLNFYKNPHPNPDPETHNFSYSSQPSSSLASPTMASATYDYHNAQLDRYLDEYKQLQRELARMKESCEKLNLITDSTEKIMGSKSSSLERSVSFVPTLKDSTIKTTSFDSVTPKSILKNRMTPTLDQPLEYPYECINRYGTLPRSRGRHCRRFSESSIDTSYLH